ncbi:MAG: 4-hydroxythreonine-4-phosphate dehydrogenase PdxA, partial [Dehalococcoidia bacterium]|nr:4-hydroxythreonine-4-phosphate dehydrogenase PdxA [Dehalococcoidia bacterium]
MSSNDNRPLVAVTIGDPAGIGPEIVVKAMADPETNQAARSLVIGDRWILEQARETCGLSLAIVSVTHPDEGQYQPGRIDLMDTGSTTAGSIQPGQIQALAGKAAYDYLRRATDLAMSGEVEAIATAPINKEALRAGGVPYLDHTEALAALTNSPYPLTIFVVGNLRIFFLTRHVSLATACTQITRKGVLEGLVQVDAALQRFGMVQARIAVAALNPHAGEGGMFGDEEIVHIAPAIIDACARGINVFGPVPADAVFHMAKTGQFDAVLSLYHDQGHIAAKTLDFERTVSITAGLPFLRSSVDHGTAFNIAGRGIASPVSMIEAIKAAAEYALKL